jgi:voltage-gated potassium channel
MQRARTHHGVFILLRRLRQPLVVLIVCYAIATLGFVLIPGRDANGAPWQMDFLHAFYFVSFLGSTIGLGEIPYPFTPQQRLWGTFAIYLTVVAWLYAFGALVAVLQDPVLRRTWLDNAFERQVRRLRDPFYLLCGYDEAGRRVARELALDGVQLVVVDQDPQRVDAVDVDDHPMPLPALVADAADPQALLTAGLRHPQCRGVLALTGDDAVNTKIALTARLLAPQHPVLAAAHEHRWHPRLAAVGATAILNPNDTFAERLAIALRTPSLHVIYEALTAQAHSVNAPLLALPPQGRGRWVLCGWGPMARAIRHRLRGTEAEIWLVDTVLDEGCDSARSVQGDPTDIATLRRAGIEQADVLVAATAQDLDNLAVVMAARALNPALFVIAHQTQRRNTPMFRASRVDLLVSSSHLIATEVLRHTRAPLLGAFLTAAAQQHESWAAALLGRLREEVGDALLESWNLTVGPSELPVACAALAAGEAVTLRRLLRRVDDATDPRDACARATPLLLQRGDTPLLLPPPDTPLQLGDVLLLAGHAQARSRLRGLALMRGLAPAAA